MNIAVVIPCFRVAAHVLEVIAGIPQNVCRIYAVDDGCPEGSGDLIERTCVDGRVRVLRHAENRGVGGALVTGYRQALDDAMDIVVKIDGDGQMDPLLLPKFVQPILDGRADYTKGNRFFSLDMVRTMPRPRLVGNAVLSFVNKAASGYWSIMDPTNGYTAISAKLLEHLPLARLEPRYFFESDMLFHLGVLRAVVQDIPMHSRYGDAASNLSIVKAGMLFPGKYAIRFVKRFFYNYLLRDFNAGSLHTLLGLAMTFGGVIFGSYHWVKSILDQVPATSGTVVLAALPVILGVQFLVAAEQYDIQNQPTRPLAPFL